MHARSHPITPELALVDPDLAETARLFLPETGDCLAARPPPTFARPQRRPSFPHAGVGAGLLLLVGLAAAVLVTFTRAPELERTTAPELPQQTDADSPAQQAPRRVATIRWPSAHGASYYNLILVRRDQRIDLWPSMPMATFKRPSRSRSAATPLVDYSWFAYAVFTEARTVRYGPLLAHGSVSVPRGSVKPQTRPG
jgi:hypothetical protein